MTMSRATPAVGQLPSYVAGQAVGSVRTLDVHDPYTGEVVGGVAMVGRADVERAIEVGRGGGAPLTRHDRHQILETARSKLVARADEFADLIRRESGLCSRDTNYEVGRAQDVLRFAALEALRDDGEIFSGDVSQQGKARKIFTLREPLLLVAAITPFNHPLNQVVHKLAPAVAVGVPTILKPSEKTPLTAVRFAELLYESGLPGHLLSVLMGSIDEVATPLIQDARVELVSFTGSVEVGQQIARTAGFKRLCLELGGNSPLLVLDDADVDLAVHLAAEGCFRNSGQRCTAVKRLLVHQAVVNEFTERLVAKARQYRCGDPADSETRVGTVIDEPAAIRLEQRIDAAVRAGARVLLGGGRRGALLEPTVIANVPRDADMVVKESFGPLAPILPVRDLDDAIELANATEYGLSSGVVTRSLASAIKAVKAIRTGTVNVNEVPGYRLESSPFGGVKASGLGVKEGVIEAMKFMTSVKTFSLPW